jgi:hypothetical protein
MTAFRLIVVCCLVVLLTGCQISKNNAMKHRSIVLSGQQIDVELPITPEEQQQGLGGRDHLDDEHGMLFDFSSSRIPSFWMKGMNFPIDILWIHSKVIIEIEQSVPADDGTKLHSPTQPIDSVLELSAGWVSRHGTSVGDRIE